MPSTTRSNFENIPRLGVNQGLERRMKLKLIKNESDYKAAMARLSALMAANPDAGSANENELDRFPFYFF